MPVNVNECSRAIEIETVGTGAVPPPSALLVWWDDHEGQDGRLMPKVPASRLGPEFGGEAEFNCQGMEEKWGL